MTLAAPASARPPFEKSTAEEELDFGAFAPPALVEAARVASRNAPTRLIRHLARKAVVRYLKNVERPFDITVEGVRLRVRPTRNRQEWMAFHEGALPDSRWLEPLFAGLDLSGVFVDVGANVGFYTLAARVALPEGWRIVAVEPHPGTVVKLRRNLRFNHACDTVVVAPYALGDAPGALRLHEPVPRNEGQNSVVKGAGVTPFVEVEAITLPRLLAQLGLSRVDLLKVDVEGYEDRAIGPMLDAIDRSCWSHRILLEHKMSDFWAVDIRERLREAGYAERDADEENLLLERAR